MSRSLQPMRTLSQWICRILERWLGLTCDLADLNLADGDVLADLAAGRD